MEPDYMMYILNLESFLMFSELLLSGDDFQFTLRDQILDLREGLLIILLLSLEC